MNLKTIITCVALIIVGPVQTSIAQPRQYLHETFAAAGGAGVFNGIDAWRTGEKQTILTCIGALPDATKKEIITTADKALTQPWAMPKLSDYREYKLNGNRVNFENLYFNRRTRLSLLCAAELIAKNGKYLPEIANGLWMILEETTWALPAHWYTNGTTEDPDPDKPIIDLFAGETSAHLACVKFLLSDELNKFSPVLMRRVDAELKKRITDPYLATDDYWWMGLKGNRRQNNWNIWINTNILKTALLAENDAAKRNAIIEKTLRCADAFLDQYPADGGCDEGPAYWSAAGGCLGEYVSMLSRATSGRLSWKDNALIHNIGSYIYKVHIDSTRFVNFADAPASTIPDPGRVYNFGELYNDAQLSGFAAYLAKISGSPSHWLGVNSLIVFSSTVRVSKQLMSIAPKAPMPQQSWLPDLQVVNLREQTGSSRGLSFMGKAGNNGESHNHNDVGNFMLYLNGAPVTIDPGKGTYTKQTFSADRYKLWYTQSQWHNCPSVNSFDQQAGADYKATNVTFKAGSKTEVFTMDLAKTYPAQAGVKVWNRSLTYDRSAGRVTLNENYELTEYISPAAINFIACKQPVKLKDGTIRLTAFTSKGTIIMSYDAAVFNAVIEEQPVSDKALEGVWGKSIYRVSLHTKSTSLKGNYTVTFSKDGR